MPRSKDAIEADRDEVNRLWLRAIELASKSPDPAIAKIEITGGEGGSVPTIVPLSEVWTAGEGLSFRLRLLIALAETGETQKYFAEKLQVAERTLGRWIRFTEKPQQGDSRNVRAFVRQLLQRLRPKGPPIDPASFRGDAFLGVDAPTRFRKWLHGEQRTSDGLALLRKQSRLEYFPTKTRDDNIARILSSLSKLDDPPVCLAIAETAGVGLSVLAQELAFERLPKHPDLRAYGVCYIPLSQTLPPGRCVTFADVLGWIQAYMSGRDMLESVPIESAFEQTEILNRIRRFVVTNPTIFIFDSFRDNLPAAPHLAAAIVDDGVIPLLKQVVHPVLGPSFPPGSSSSARKSRFLVLSETEVDTRRLGWGEATRCDFGRAPKDALETIVAQSPLKNQEIVLKRMTGRGEFVDEVKLALLDAVLALDPTISFDGDTPHATLASHLLKAAAKSDCGALLLVILATTFGPMRLDTIARMIGQCAGVFKASGHAAIMTGKDYTVTAEMLKVHAEQMSGLVCLTPDTIIPELDQHAHHMEALDVELGPFGRIQADPSRKEERDTIEFRSPQIRTLMLKAVHTDAINSIHKDNRDIALLHRVMAEECIRQHAIMLRHAERPDIRSIRLHRRLLQGLYHGVFACATVKSDADRLCEATPGSLPRVSTDLFSALFFGYVRKILEFPPAWEMSRHYCADNLRVDLLLLALNAPGPGSKSWVMLDQADKKGTLAPKGLGWFRGKNDERLNLVAELVVSLAKSAIQTNDMQTAAAAIDLLKELSERPGFSSSVLHECHKLEIDQQILTGDAENGPLTVLESALPEQLHVSAIRQRLAYAIRAVRRDQLIDPDIAIAPSKRIRRTSNDDDALLSAIETAGIRSGSVLTTEIDELAAFCITAARAADFSLKRLIDLLNRLAEMEAIAADSSASNSTGAAPDVVPYLRSYILFSAVNRIIDVRQHDDPAGQTRLTNAHSSRIFVRIALELRKISAGHRMQLLSEYKGSPRDKFAFRSLPPPDLFFRAARREADDLLRDLHRFPPEQSAMLVLEGTFYRTVAGDHASAHQIMEIADTHLINAADRVRMRIRFYFERCKILRRFVEEHRTSDPALARLYLADARYDLDRMKALVSGLGKTFWEQLVQLQEERVAVFEA